ncbi:Thiol-disulfide isomerase or thioredoxin [Filimonas lacunae]|uniref:Thiol-disulfide isomerase or thioredoxin n=1 Tax=Filimonas lacunae TaxID=477680 RepID=A0A173MJ80_9BACT|nr:redoxin domain-containing protein [Filimonas lacunae]BAV07550.1 thiol:disulfide oxidoreductase related to ResA [Filimonas lacunae]SIT29985.1 Thiol-disulfide isomerase or thioredoxin [Filimonas lacunae]
MRTKVMLTVLLAGSLYQGWAQNTDSTIQYYTRLAKSSDEKDKALLKNTLYQLLKSDKEDDWLTARRFFYQLNEINVSDSITKADRVKFPLGQVVRDSEVEPIYNEKDPVKKEEMFKAWISKYPPEKLGSDRIVYDYARNSVSTAYANEDNVEKAVYYAGQIETGPWRGEGYASAAQALRKKGHLAEAADLYKKARAISYEYLTTKRNEPGAGFAAMGFRGYSTQLASVYVDQKRYEEALPILKEAHDSSKTVSAATNSAYVQVLEKLGKNNEAFDVIDESVKEGQATGEMKATLKRLYAKVKGSDAGYDEYMATVNKQLAAKIRKDLAKQMIKETAPLFTLKDVNGKTVSLADYKGKTVVVDFWATWCGPCKRSFPAMKLAQAKYGSNSDVQFLFIHTWEKEENATASAKAYITDNKYPFEVLMDLKNAKGVNEVVTSYKVSGIPTKFIVDKNGDIRFRFTGFSEGEDAAVEEVSAMIELAQKG